MFRNLKRLSGLTVLLALMAGHAVLAAEDVELDPFTGFAMVGDWQLVRSNCIACHSARLVTQQSGSASQWLDVIRWMQKKQNLWEFDPLTEAKIVAYLAENYPPKTAQRRAALPRELMPPNPFVADNSASQSSSQ
jgi:mono/diheme cytochrome c family protein